MTTKSNPRFDRDCAAYRGMGLVAALVEYDLIPAFCKDKAQSIVADFNQANALMEQQRLAEKDAKELQ